MERSPIQDTFTGSFNNGFMPGIQAWDTFDEEHGTWATGIFKNTTNIFDDGFGDGEYNWTSRATFLPLYEEEETTYCMSASREVSAIPTMAHCDIVPDPLRNGAPSGLNPVFIDTTSFLCSQQDMLGLELAGNYGAFSFPQSELMNSWSQNTISPAGPLAGSQCRDGLRKLLLCRGALLPHRRVASI